MPSRRIERVLVANRGEVAARIIRTCDRLGIDTVLAASQQDLDSLPARMATRTLCVGPAKAAASYLNVEAIVHAAAATGCDAIHPGFGFLSEDRRLAEACAEVDVAFVGPPPFVLELFGDKVSARKAAERSGVPVSQGAQVESVEHAVDVAADIGYPLMLKASAGGGGKGIKLLDCEEALRREFALASAEAAAAFGDGRLHLEKFVARAKHVEVQVAVDGHGTAVHLGERDCSVQYRYQKIVEEAPCAVLSPDVRERMCQAAVRLLQENGFVGIGTVEFLLDADTHEFLFLEVNPRLQVEHPITEEITGRDLVEIQLRIASGAPLGFGQDDVRFSGHAIECRVNAQDPARDLAPTPGRIIEWELPEGNDVRVDTHCYAGYLVPPHYDSMMAKLIVSGADRAAAVAAARSAVRTFHVSGLPTNLSVVADVLASETFDSGGTTTQWFTDFYERHDGDRTGAEMQER